MPAAPPRARTIPLAGAPEHATPAEPARASRDKHATRYPARWAVASRGRHAPPTATVATLHAPAPALPATCKASKGLAPTSRLEQRLTATTLSAPAQEPPVRDPAARRGRVPTQPAVAALRPPARGRATSRRPPVAMALAARHRRKPAPATLSAHGTH